MQTFEERVRDNPESFMRRASFGQGESGQVCNLCGADDWSRPIKHEPWCPIAVIHRGRMPVGHAIKEETPA